MAKLSYSNWFWSVGVVSLVRIAMPGGVTDAWVWRSSEIDSVRMLRAGTVNSVMIWQPSGIHLGSNEIVYAFSMVRIARPGGFTHAWILMSCGIEYVWIWSQVELVLCGVKGQVDLIKLVLKDVCSQFGKDRKARWSHSCMDLKNKRAWCSKDLKARWN